MTGRDSIRPATLREMAEATSRLSDLLAAIKGFDEFAPVGYLTVSSFNGVPSLAVQMDSPDDAGQAVLLASLLGLETDDHGGRGTWNDCRVEVYAPRRVKREAA